VSSIPTSLIIVLLVAAWLVVLVPMFARRREAVPESDDEATGFRVLRRERKARKRALRAGHAEGDGYDMDVTATDSAYAVEVDEYDDRPVPDDAADEWAAEQERSARRHPARRDEPDDVRRRNDYPIEDGLRPVPTRKGRGGFDPDAAEATRMFKYRRRRRVLLLLVTLLLGSIAAAYYLTPMAWAGTAVVGLLLVGFLVYLRRQVRIEAEIRARRLARLRRARQIRPEARGGYDERSASPYRPAARSNAPLPTDAVTMASTVPPAAQRGGRVVVDLDDDDPAFEDLERYHSPVYRRQAG
jgi:hypothetical protein